MATLNEIIAQAIYRTSTIGGRIVQTASDVLQLDIDSVNILRDIVISVCQQEMGVFTQEIKNTHFTTPGTGYQPISHPDKHVKPPPKHPNEGNIPETSIIDQTTIDVKRMNMNTHQVPD